MDIRTFLVFALFGTFVLITSFVNLSVEGSVTLNCPTTNQNTNLIRGSKDLTTVPGQLNQTFICIDLRGNIIEGINEMDFAGLTSLRILLLSDNLISNIDDSSFSSLVDLNTLCLDNNRLRILNPTHFRGLANLQALLINDNKELNIDPCMFSNLVSLSSLNLQNTKVDLDAELVTAKSTCSSPTFPYVENLASLSIGYEGTSNSSNASILGNFSSLRRITLYGFSKASFGNSDISTLNHLEGLTILATDVFPKEFLKSSSLIELVIQESTFKCLPKDAFYNLPALKSLVIIRNSLAFIDINAFSGASGLTFINLAFNKLVSLPEGIFNDVNDTFPPNFNLNENDWHCDCKLKWMQSFEPFENEQIFCDTPISEAGMSVFSVNLECNSDSEEETSSKMKDDVCKVPEDFVQQPTRGNEPSQATTTNQSPSQATPANQVLIYVAVVGVVILIFLIILLIIAVAVVNKKMKNELPAPPRCRNNSSPSDDADYTNPTKIEDDPLYDMAPTGRPDGKDVVTWPCPHISNTSQHPNQKAKKNYVKAVATPCNTLVKVGNTTSSPEYVNTNHRKTSSSTELKAVMARMGHGVKGDSDQPYYANSAPRNPSRPRRPPR